MDADFPGVSTKSSEGGSPEMERIKFYQIQCLFFIKSKEYKCLFSIKLVFLMLHHHIFIETKPNHILQSMTFSDANKNGVVSDNEKKDDR